MNERELQREYVVRWKKLGPILEEIQDREIREADTAAVIRSMDQAFQIALRDSPPRETSGLVEWHRRAAAWSHRG
jgi:hypothetical protein